MSGIQQLTIYEGTSIPSEINFVKGNAKFDFKLMLTPGTTNCQVQYQIKNAGGLSRVLINGNGSLWVVSSSDYSEDEWTTVPNVSFNRTSDMSIIVGISNIERDPASPDFPADYKRSMTLDIQQVTKYRVNNEILFYNYSGGSAIKSLSLTGDYLTRPSTVVLSATEFPEVTRPGYQFVGWDVYDYETHVTVSGEEDINIKAGEDIEITALWERTTNISVYNGEEWKTGEVYVYNGEEWKQGEPYIYNGDEWVNGI